MEHFCANILKSGHWPRTRCRLKIFYFLALAAILFNGAEPLWPSWIFDLHLFRSWSHPVAKEQISAQSDLRFEKRCRKLIFKMAAVVASLDFLLAHLAILCLISALMLIIKFRFNWIIEEMSKYELSKFFPYKCIGPIQMHGKQIWPSRKKVKCQRRTIILAILVDLLSPRICAKTRPQGLFGSGKEDF